MWKDFLYFTRGEQRGILLLALLILIVFSLPSLYEYFHEPDSPDPAETEAFEHDYREFMASLDSIETHRKKRKFIPNSRPELTPEIFDPNTADSATFSRMGLPAWMVRNILRYRAKQGRFRHPEDFRKIYGLTSGQYETLLPYIHIKEQVPEWKKDTVKIRLADVVRKDSVVKYPVGTVLDLNRADTAELKKIPGVGSAIARMIVGYRYRLGGFCRVEQLNEIRLNAEVLRPWFRVDTADIARINLNRAGVQRMMNHPYINFYQAKVIDQYRKRNGRLRSLRDLSLYEEFSEADLLRIRPYVCFD